MFFTKAILVEKIIFSFINFRIIVEFRYILILRKVPTFGLKTYLKEIVKKKTALDPVKKIKK